MLCLYLMSIAFITPACNESCCCLQGLSSKKYFANKAKLDWSVILCLFQTGTGGDHDHMFFLSTFSEYVTFLSLPYNATLVRVINQRPLFTHLGELNEKERWGYRQSSNKFVKANRQDPWGKFWVMQFVCLWDAFFWNIWFKSNWFLANEQPGAASTEGLCLHQILTSLQPLFF